MQNVTILFNPVAPVLIDPNGSVYGTTEGGGEHNLGLVFNLRPSPSRPVSVIAPWNETVIHQFAGSPDGSYPESGLVRDAAGNLHGTTHGGGAHDDGTVYELAPSNGGWTYTLLYSFGGAGDGVSPTAGLTIDGAGNLYGTTSGGGIYNDYGTVFELSPSANGWIYKSLHSFQYDEGTDVRAGVVLDSAGNLYGATSEYGPAGAGTVYELSPSDGTWTLTVLQAWPGSVGSRSSDWAIDAAGNLYGTTYEYGPNNDGFIFKLSPGSNGWTTTIPYDFPDRGLYGSQPVGGVIVDSSGILYGTTVYGGSGGGGVVWQISQD